MLSWAEDIEKCEPSFSKSQEGMGVSNSEARKNVCPKVLANKNQQALTTSIIHEMFQSEIFKEAIKQTISEVFINLDSFPSQVADGQVVSNYLLAPFNPKSNTFDKVHILTQVAAPWRKPAMLQMMMQIGI